MRLEPPDVTGSDALAETIGGLFDIPEQDLDNQLEDIASIQESTNTTEGIKQTDIDKSDASSDFGDLF